MASNAARDESPQTRVLLIPDVAKILGRSELATRRAIVAGKIPARKMGFRVVVLAHELDEYLRNLPMKKTSA